MVDVGHADAASGNSLHILGERLHLGTVTFIG